MAFRPRLSVGAGVRRDEGCPPATSVSSSPKRTRGAEARRHLRQDAGLDLGRPMTFHYLDATMRAFCPKATMTTSPSRSVRCCPARRSSASAGSAASPPSTARAGEAVGELYVARYFSPEAKAEMPKLVENLRAAYKARIEAFRLDGSRSHTRRSPSSPPSRVKIGYPDKWRWDYPTWRSWPATRSANMEHVRPSRNGAVIWRGSKSRPTATSGSCRSASTPT